VQEYKTLKANPETLGKGEQDTELINYRQNPFITLPIYCAFCRLKICGNSTFSKSNVLSFFLVYHLVSLCHILAILTVFQISNFFIIMIPVMVICGL
jgi:hypothetical protein